MNNLPPNTTSELKIIDIVAFVATADTGSLSQAALLHSCSQSMISRRVQELETVVGGRLFSRTGRGVHLTELGSALLPYARALLGNANQFLDHATSTQEHLTGIVHVALPRWSADGPVSALVNLVAETYPKIRLVIHETYSKDTVDRLAVGKLDIGIFNSRSPDAPLNAQLLFSSDLVLLGRRGSPLVAQPTVPLATLDGARAVTPSTPNQIEAVLSTVLKDRNIKLRIDLEVNSGAMIREVVRHSDRYGITLVHGIKGDLADGGLAAARIVDPSLTLYTFCATGPKHLITNASRAVEKCVVSIMRAHHQSVMRLMPGSDQTGPAELSPG